MKKIVLFSLLVLFIGKSPVMAQFSESKERKKMWRKSGKRHKKREAFNPYLDKKHKDKPSVKAAKEEKEGVRKMRRDYKRRNKKEMKKRGIKP